MALLEAFQRYVAENDLATHDDRILLTVSGGVDSMVMLSLFTRSDLKWGRDEDEDNRAWALRCMRMASRMMRPAIGKKPKR